MFSLLSVFLFACEINNEAKQSQPIEQEIYDPASDLEAIKAVMEMQEAAWSKGDLEQFMQGYWESDQLTFIGSRGLSYGWETTMNNYKKGYPDKSAMGTLSFEILELRSLSPEYCYMIGQYTLIREEDDDLGGYFTLLWRKVNGEWKVVADQTCG